LEVISAEVPTCGVEGRGGVLTCLAREQRGSKPHLARDHVLFDPPWFPYIRGRVGGAEIRGVEGIRVGSVPDLERLETRPYVKRMREIASGSLEGWKSGR
jgi:hypothetical protein